MFLLGQTISGLGVQFPMLESVPNSSLAICQAALFAPQEYSFSLDLAGHARTQSDSCRSGHVRTQSVNLKADIRP